MIRRLLLILAWLAPPAVAQTRPADHWVGTWACAQQAVYPAIAPPAPGLAKATLRQVVRLSLGGGRLRVRLANDFGGRELTIHAAHVARPTGLSAIDPQTDTPLMFDGKTTVTIPAGTSTWSDPADFPVKAGGDLAVTLRLGEIDADHITTHPGARCTSFAAPGDAVSAEVLPNATASEHWYFLSGVDVVADTRAATVVTIGDSITDGRGSTTNENGRWPDALARRLAGRPVAVLNAGIGGNRVLRDGLGPNALARFDRDVLAQTSAKWVIVLEGVNDLGTAAPADAAATADRLIAAYRQMIVRAHARDLKIFGGTITPFAGSPYNAPEHEAARQRVNAFVRDGGAFDGVVDFDAAVRDPSRPAALRIECDSGDHLHLNDHGYRVMADAVDLNLLTD